MHFGFVSRETFFHTTFSFTITRFLSQRLFYSYTVARLFPEDDTFVIKCNRKYASINRNDNAEVMTTMMNINLFHFPRHFSTRNVGVRYIFKRTVRRNIVLRIFEKISDSDSLLTVSKIVGGNLLN